MSLKHEAHDNEAQLTLDGAQEKRSWFRGTFFNATIVGLVAFACPGLYNAMSSTGAGGAQTPYLVMTGNIILNSLMAGACVFASVYANHFGLKATFITGTVGYVIYSAALYQNNRYGTKWFVLFGSAACGLSAGLFWAAEAAIMIGYPEAHKRGRYLSMWLAYRNSGSILGGAINLAFNATGKTTGKLDFRTFIVFVALQCIGPFVAFFLTPPDKVQRKDGTRVKLNTKHSDIYELKQLAKLFFDKRVLFLFPFFFWVTFPLSYVGSYLTLNFSVRSRALASLVSALVQITGNLFFGLFLDWSKLTYNQRARYSYIFLMTLGGASWIWAAVVQTGYSSHKQTFDWVDPGFARGWVLYLLIQLVFALGYNYAYWVVGGIVTEPAEVVRFTAIVRGVEALGGVPASIIGSTHVSLVVPMAVNFGLWALAVIPTYLVVRHIGLDAEGHDVDLVAPHAPAGPAVDVPPVVVGDDRDSTTKSG